MKKTAPDGAVSGMPAIRETGPGKNLQAITVSTHFHPFSRDFPYTFLKINLIPRGKAHLLRSYTSQHDYLRSIFGDDATGIRFEISNKMRQFFGR